MYKLEAEMAKDHGNDVGTGTISVLTQDADPYQELPDVSHRNIAVMFAICELVLIKRLNLRMDQLLDRLFNGLPKEWTRERVQREAAPLYVYNIIERNLAKLLGEPSALLKAGMFGSVRSDFGEKTLWVFNLLRFILQFIVTLIATPAFYFEQVLPAVSLLYNRNKITDVVQADWRRALVRYTRASFAGKVLRRPQGDIFSMLWWAPGFTAGAVTFWYKEGARIFHQLVELDPRDVIEACGRFVVGDQRVQEVGDRLVFQGEEIAQRIKLYPMSNGNGGRYYAAPAPLDDSSASDFKFGWQIIQDVIVRNRQGQVWTIMRQGEVYCAEAGCSLVVYDYEPLAWWRRRLASLTAGVALLFKPLLWLLVRIVGWCVRYLDARAIRDWERAEHTELEAMLEAFGREHFASRQEMDEALRGEIEEIQLPECVVLRIDFEGHTQRRMRMGTVPLRQVLRPFWEALFDFDVNPLVQHGGLPRELRFGDAVVRFGNHTGDGGYVFIYNAPMMELVQTAVILAAELHEVAERVWAESGWDPLPLRVTIDAGGVDLVAYGRRRNPNDPEDDRRVNVRFFAEGTPLDNCARMDVVAKQLRTQARAAGSDARWMTLMPLDLFRCAEHSGIEDYEDFGVVDVRDMGPTHLVRVVHRGGHRVKWK